MEQPTASLLVLAVSTAILVGLWTMLHTPTDPPLREPAVAADGLSVPEKSLPPPPNTDALSDPENPLDLRSSAAPPPTEAASDHWTKKPAGEADLSGSQPAG